MQYIACKDDFIIYQSIVLLKKYIGRGYNRVLSIK